MAVTLAKVWQPPVTHLHDEADPRGRTLCGLTITRDWDGAGDVIDQADIDDGVAAGCHGCRHLAEKRHPKVPA